MTSPATLLAALEFAAARHRDQRRKGSGAPPYINHPIQVARLLAEVGGIEDHITLTAAVLHDTIEDTETTADELEERFGADVRDVVMEMTDDTSLPKAERKHLQIERAPGLSSRAKQLKIADKTSNIREIVQDPPVGWSLERRRDYLDWADAVVAGCRGVNPALEMHYDAVMRQCRATLEDAICTRSTLH
ncbi:MAG: HD domain-containing protein [Longimicrobiales bacterium]